jgi:hypothetical protein
MVSVREPRWVALASRDPGRARAELDARIELLRQRAPTSARARAANPQLPVLTFEPPAGQRVRLRELERRLASFASGTADAGLARFVQQQAPLSLAAVASRLTRIDWRDPDEVAQGRRLQALLEAATGCRDLPVLGDEHAAPEQFVAANRSLGQLWLWFVNEFAHTPRTWAVYRQLLGR